MFRNHFGHQPYQGVCQGQHHCNRYGVEEGMEHSQLDLRGRREEFLKQVPERDVEPSQYQSGKHKQDDAGAVEQQVDKRRSFGICPAGHARNDRHYAGADVGTHRQVNTLVNTDEPGHHHGQRNGSHDGRALDNGSENRAQQHQQDGIADSGEERFHPFQRGKSIHGAAHKLQTHEQQAESRQNAAQCLGSAFLGKDAQESAQPGKGREDDACRYGIAAKHTQGHNLGGNGCADIGAIDNGGSL